MISVLEARQLALAAVRKREGIDLFITRIDEAITKAAEAPRGLHKIDIRVATDGMDGDAVARVALLYRGNEWGVLVDYEHSTMILRAPHGVGRADEIGLEWSTRKITFEDVPGAPVAMRIVSERQGGGGEASMFGIADAELLELIAAMTIIAKRRGLLRSADG